MITYLYIQRIVAFPIKVTFPIPMRPIKERNKSPINKNPPMPLSSAQMSLNPVFGFALLLWSQ
jgi:hypothetical protein